MPGAMPCSPWSESRARTTSTRRIWPDSRRRVHQRRATVSIGERSTEAVRPRPSARPGLLARTGLLAPSPRTASRGRRPNRPSLRRHRPPCAIGSSASSLASPLRTKPPRGRSVRSEPRTLQANRLNALKSTGPRTEEGKRISRRNALRHGLTAETVIDGLEDREDYRGFEAAIIADYDAETAVERELVLRLASLLWRLRRIIAIETDLFQIQAEI